MVTLAGSHPKKFFPLPGRFGVIQMDPVAMVEPLGDEEALHLAKAIQTRKYLAYLLCNMELPWPNRPWYGYYILPIGPTLRSEVPEKAITADMCVPIAPNVAHPSGRPPVVTEPPFPFSNCYYWVDSETRVRVRSGIEFDEAHAVCLPHMTRSKLQRVFDEDMDRAYDAIEERRNAAMEEDQHDLAAETSPEKTTDSSASNDESDPHLFDRPDERSCSSSSSCGESSPSQSVDSFKAFAAFDPFGFHLDADIELCPLVDFCFDLTDHIAQDEIGDPVDFWREGAEVAAIIRAAQERASILRSSPAPDEVIDVDDAGRVDILPSTLVARVQSTHMDSQAAPLDIPRTVPTPETVGRMGNVTSMSGHRIGSYVRHLKDVLNLPQTLQRLRRSVRQVSRAVALPYIPYWP